MNFFENQWVEVFRVGHHTDSSGRAQEWDSSDLAEIVRNYNAKKIEGHEAPVVIGHPKDNAPAFGWVEALKTDGKRLFATFKQLVPEFVEAVKKGLYKKRSISLYPDLTLRHIGFLGAVPPAVKGLADIAFSEDSGVTIEFHSNIKTEKQTNKKEVNNMKEKDLDPALDAGKQISKDQEISRLKSQLRQEKRKSRLAEYKEYVSRLHGDGKIVSDQQNSIVELMEVMHKVGEYNFSDGRVNVLQRFRTYLANQPQLVSFGEAVKEEIVRQSPAGEQLNLLTMERAKKDSISFSAALSLVQIENPELARATASEI